jgi:N-acetylneuraminate synthase/sialic acid synthase
MKTLMQKLVSKKNAAYIIAEIGQNHQGDLDMAKRYIEVYARAGADAVKFQMRDNKTLFSADQLERPYDSENAFADTYGAHREYLEFTPEQMRELKVTSEEHGVDFMCTAFDDVSLGHLQDMGVKLIKMCSFDMGNIPFAQKVIATGIPFVLSVGGASCEKVSKFVRYLIDQGAKFTLLHCVSNYPCPADSLALGRVPELKKEFPEIQVGLSDHFNGILSAAVGYMLGAEVFEKHVTFDRSMKGTDHSFALTEHGFINFVRDINRTQVMCRSELHKETGNEPVFKKLGKVLVAAKDIAAGSAVDFSDLTSQIRGPGLPVRESVLLMGRTWKKSYAAGDTIDVAEIQLD